MRHARLDDSHRVISAAFFFSLAAAFSLANGTTALAGKDHCRTIELSGQAGAASADQVELQVTDLQGNVLDRSCKIAVQTLECADDFARRIVGQWASGTPTLCPTFPAEPSDLGKKTCGKNLDLAPILDHPIFCKHKFKKAKIKGGPNSVPFGTCPQLPTSGQPADGELKRPARVEVCCHEIADPVIAGNFNFTDKTHCKGKPLGKTLTSPLRIQISIHDRIKRPGDPQSGIFFEPKLPDNQPEVPVGISSRAVSLDPIGFVQRPDTSLKTCRADIAKTGGRIPRIVATRLVACHEAVMSGQLTANCNVVDANSDPDGVVQAAVQALKLTAQQSCEKPTSSDPPRVSPTLYGLNQCPFPCEEIALDACSAGNVGASCEFDRDCDSAPGAGDGKCGSWNDAADCIACLQEKAVTSAITEVYGNPPPGSGLPSEVQACLNQLGKSLVRVIDTNVKETLSCQKKADASKLTLPADTPQCKDVDLKNLRLKTASKAEDDIFKVCGSIDFQTLNSCADDPLGVVHCLVGASMQAAAQASEATYPESDTIPTFSALAALNITATLDVGNDVEPQIATDRTGNWVATWASDDPLSGQGSDFDIFVATSSDNGNSWGLPSPLNVNAAVDVGADLDQQIATDAQGKWLAVWASKDPGGPLGADYDILASESLDNGASWSPPQALNDNAATNSGDDSHPVMTTDRSGNWIVVWESNGSLGGTLGTDSDILVATSADNGSSWTPPALLNSNGAGGEDTRPQIATDRAGNWIVVWHSDDPLGSTESVGTDTDVFVAVSSDNGTSWSPARALNSNAGFDTGGDFRPKITTNRVGNWVVAWESTEDLLGTVGADVDLLVARSNDNGANWTSPEALNNNAEFDSGVDQLQSITSDGVSTWLAVWSSNDTLSGLIGTDQDILIASSVSNGAQWSAPRPLNSNAATDSGNDWAPQIETDGLGRWIGVWHTTDDLGGPTGLDADIVFTLGD